MGDINELRQARQATSGAITLGKIQKWEDKKQAQMTPISFPGQDAGKTESIDTLGIIAYIIIEGRITGTFSELQQTIALIRNIMDGRQIASTYLFSPFINSRDFNNDIKRGAMGITTSTATNILAASGVNFGALGIRKYDKVKNLTTGNTTYVSTDPTTTGTLDLDDNIFTGIGQSYAVTSNIAVKLLNFETEWELPGLSYVDYTLSLIQVRG